MQQPAHSFRLHSLTLWRKVVLSGKVSNRRWGIFLKELHLYWNKHQEVKLEQCQRPSGMCQKWKQDHGECNISPHTHTGSVYWENRPQQCRILGHSFGRAIRSDLRLQHSLRNYQLLHSHFVKEPTRWLINNQETRKDRIGLGPEQEQFEHRNHKPIGPNMPEKPRDWVWFIY
jgi:hypothetical protein